MTLFKFFECDIATFTQDFQVLYPPLVHLGCVTFWSQFQQVNRTELRTLLILL